MRPERVIGFFVVLAGCAVDLAQPGIEEGRVTIAAVQLAPEDVAGASALCGELTLPQSADLCRITVVFSLNERSKQVGSVCKNITTSPWQEECAFIQVDYALRWQSPPMHLAACATLDPRWAPYCVDHGFEAWQLGYLGSGGFPGWFNAAELEAQLAAVRRSLPHESEQLVAFEDEMRRLAGQGGVDTEMAQWW